MVVAAVSKLKIIAHPLLRLESFMWDLFGFKRRQKQLNRIEAKIGHLSKAVCALLESHHDDVALIEAAAKLKRKTDELAAAVSSAPNNPPEEF